MIAGELNSWTKGCPKIPHHSERQALPVMSENQICLRLLGLLLAPVGGAWWNVIAAVSAGRDVKRIGVGDSSEVDVSGVVCAKGGWPVAWGYGLGAAEISAGKQGEPVRAAPSGVIDAAVR